MNRSTIPMRRCDSNAQVLDFLVARYGEFVLLRPRLSWHTAALWGLPPAILLFGVAMLVAMARRRNNLPAAIAPADLTAVEQVRVDELIRGEGAP
jgi:cytochrome c-type biogenesis protein CcmH